jgi:glycosyltransferase involved in cell wall biosynthesis
MRSVSLLAFPSRYEPCGLVVLEALASGLPVVTTRAAGAAEMLAGEAGTLLEDSEDRDGMAAALRRLAGLGEDHRAELGRAARALAERYAWPQVARHHVDLLEASARSGARRGIHRGVAPPRVAAT